jgi:hypothetical protein
VPAPVLLFCTKCPTEVEYSFDNNSIVYSITFGCWLNGKKYDIQIMPNAEKKICIV